MSIDLGHLIKFYQGIKSVTNCIAMVSTSGPSIFLIQESFDNIYFYDSVHQIDFKTLPNIDDDGFCINFSLNARYARLKCLSGNKVTVRATIGGKKIIPCLDDQLKIAVLS